MESHITREAALELLRKYNKDPFTPASCLPEREEGAGIGWEG